MVIAILADVLPIPFDPTPTNVFFLGGSVVAFFALVAGGGFVIYRLLRGRKPEQDK